MSQERGRPLPVTIGKQKENTPPLQLSHNDMATIKLDLPLSSRKTHKLAHHLRVATRKRKLFEPGLKETISSRHRSLDAIFEVKKLSFDNHTCPVVSCSDSNGLIDILNEKRHQITNDTLAFKVGIDVGGGYLNQDDVFFQSPKGRQLYSDGVASNA